MQSIINELLFRLFYAFLCFCCLSGLLYFSYGWQWDYFSAAFAYQYQNVDYCFSESIVRDQSSQWGLKFSASSNVGQLLPSPLLPLAYEQSLQSYEHTPLCGFKASEASKRANQWFTSEATVARSWNLIYYTSSMYFYPLALRHTGFLITGFFTVYQTTIILLQIYAFLCPGFVNRLIYLNFLCVLGYHCSFINAGLAAQSVLVEFFIERLDSELQQGFKE